MAGSVRVAGALAAEPWQQRRLRGRHQPLRHTLVKLVEEDPDLAIFHIVHVSPDKMARYGVLHSMHTGMLMALVGKRKDWSESRIDSAVKAALTMNLSITALQITLAQQVEPPRPISARPFAAHPWPPGTCCGSWA